ncbi:MAG: bifunctional transaldolase/phosoglucose isomerase [Syntrophaceae bacterium]|nr:bifunctional transaldolase/phosoglucose isomerase [Syntrophaceae bacterium]
MDYIRRHMMTSGELKQLIEEDGLRGVTSNPSIFEKAIAGSHDYDEAIRTLALEGKSIDEIYQALTVEDVQQAADLFRPIYHRLNGRDGFVSLEVNPHLAHDTEGTISEARRLWSSISRPNVMIKVPATREGLPAIRQLISEGINVNVTLLFGLPRYREVAEAYIGGLEERTTRGDPVNPLASVASFFLSRIDVLVDTILERRMKDGEARAEKGANLLGKVAIASAKIAYQIYKEIFSSERFSKLVGRGAKPQRVLWASTSTKNPNYSDVKYVEDSIGPETVNTLPQETLNAYRDHGDPGLRLEEGLEEAHQVLRQLAEVGIDINQVTQQLEDEGVEKFNKPYDSLMETLKTKRAAALKEAVDRQALDTPKYKAAVQKGLNRLQESNFSVRLWRKDPNLWKTDAGNQKTIRQGLGWLHVAEKMEEHLGALSDFVSEIRAAGFRKVVHMGMGGSSLAPLAFERIFPTGEHGIPLVVLDTTDPQTILRIERESSLTETLFIVASKSGTTAEPLAFGEYFYSKVKALKGEQAGKNFVAITDPGTPLVQIARDRSFRRTFLNFVDIGGRYSALSYFGLVPAALTGVDISELLIRALRMKHACDSCVPSQENPGVVLGVGMGELAKHQRDKVTFLMPETISTFGMWLEQLLAESTGKEEKDLLPVAGESVGPPSVYGKDRLFAYLRLQGETDRAFENGIADLKGAGHPVVTIQMDDLLDIGQEFFRWEVATATAGAILGINPFDQPNVQESKDNTDHLLKEMDRTGRLFEPDPDLREDPLQFYGGGKRKNPAEYLKTFFAKAQPGYYIAFQAYLSENPEIHQRLQSIRIRLRDAFHLATTLGYGPRFLHSTGQFHKGGPNTGLFLQLTADDSEDTPVPGTSYTFGIFKRAQALGDLKALQDHGRRVMRVHLGKDVLRGLDALSQILEQAIGKKRVRAPQGEKKRK